MKRILGKAALLLLAATMPVTASAKAGLDGHWRNPKGSVIVEVARCGSGYCGTVVEASAKAKATARRGGTDDLVGTQILWGMRPAGHGIFKGQAFDPKRNIRAPATIRMTGPSTFIIRGCVLSFICKEQRWTRVS